MENQCCLNGTVNLSLGCANGSLKCVNYSSPVPIIGVYIFVASLACVLVMLYDVVVAGIIPRKRWLPCKYFQLNSVTLTLLAVATKLPVDLTTSMPGSHDQLSKLTGIAIICISMGFLAPSLGASGESECFTNMVALTIFVGTVAANIIIQLSTGVIFLFFVEHIIMLSLMLLLLLMLWHISFDIKTVKRIDAGAYSNLLSKGETGSMFERLKLCYVYAYYSNPQFRISIDSVNVVVSSLTLGCFIIIIETTIRSHTSKKLNSCGGTSDYSWSVKYIVYSQIVAVIVGTIAVVVRCILLFTRMDLVSIFVSCLPDAEHVIQRKQTMRSKGITWLGLRNTCVDLVSILVPCLPGEEHAIQRKRTMRAMGKTWLGLRNTCVSIIKYIIKIIALIVQCCIVFPLQLVRDGILGIKKEDDRLEYFGGVAATTYTVRKSLDDMIKLKKRVSRRAYQPSRYLLRSSLRRLDDMEIKDGVHSIKVCSLSVALLVKIAEVFLPEIDIKSLLNAFHEAKDVILFINKAIQPINTGNTNGFEYENYHRFEYAKALWIGGGFTCLLSEPIRPGEDPGITLRKLREKLQSDYIWDDLRTVIDFILRGRHGTIEELKENIEQLFVDMLHVLYAQLPIAICKSLRASPAENFEESVRLTMGFLFQIGLMECHNSWSFSEGMSCIVSDGASTSRGASASGDSAQLQRLRGIVLDRRMAQDFVLTEQSSRPRSGLIGNICNC